MNAQQQELFDRAVLNVLDQERTRFGLNAEAISLHMLRFGFRNPDRDTLLDRIDYLVRHELVEEVVKETHRANRAWRITERGIQHLDQ